MSEQEENHTRLTWDRGSPRDNPISFRRPDTWFVLGGARGSGKSSTLEYIGVHYHNEGHCIIDLFGSKDGEGLAWLRSPYAIGARILLLHGNGVKVIAPPGVDVKPALEFQLKDIYDYDFIISANPLYTTYEDEYICAGHITDTLYQRRSWKRLVFLIVREASNLYYSRLLICKDQNIAKSQMVYLIREARHMGVALGLDSLRLLSIDIDIRELTDFLIIKRMGISGLPKDIKWLYKYYREEPVRTMAPSDFIMVCKTGGLCHGAFQKIPWHKQESEDIVSITGLEIEYSIGEQVAGYSQSQNVTDLQHCEIIRLYVEDGIGMDRIASQPTIMRSSNTVWRLIRNHNVDVTTQGACPKCQRGRGKYPHQILARDEDLVTSDDHSEKTSI